MKKPGTKQLLVEVPMELADELDRYCEANGRLKGWLVRNAIETFLANEQKNESRFIVRLDEPTADDLAAFRKARENAPPHEIATRAITDYIAYVLKHEPLTKAQFDLEKNQIREARTRSNLSVLDGGRH
jgi:predicted transcriptional regulator